jgi:hypothetical protein
MDDQNQAENSQRESNIEWQKLELERERLKLDRESHEVSSKLDLERSALERAKERTTKLQISLPILVSVLAIVLSSYGEYRRSAQAKLSEERQFSFQRESQERQSNLQYEEMQIPLHQRRLELFKKLTEHASSQAEIEKEFFKLFPSESLDIEAERDTTESSFEQRRANSAPSPSPKR